MFQKILIANRGEIAVRIISTAADLGIPTVAVHSEADSSSFHVRCADEAVNLGDGPATENYLNSEAIIAAAHKTGAEAIHPGYGFLSENPNFARAVTDAGLTFIGPPAEAIATMGGKITAREVAVAAEVPLAPGSNEAINDGAHVRNFGLEHGYPILIKASAGGGGRGMRRVNSPEEAEEALTSAVREAEAAFGNGQVYLERYLTDARHVEIQILADLQGNTIYLGDRDCSVQRRHQKLIEEAPAPGLSEQLRTNMGEAAVRLARHVGYVGAGTVEFMVEGGRFYFLEMNTRIQVEHPVTEMVQGLDLVAEQIRVAAGETLSRLESGSPARGAAIEARINAEDITGGQFTPDPGMITSLQAPAELGVRFDTGYQSGDEVLPLYDSLIGKLISWGPTRESAIARLLRGLNALQIEGVKTTIPAAQLVLEHEDFRDLRFNTLWLESAVDFPEPALDNQSDDGQDVELPLARDEVEVGGRFYTIPFFSEPVPGIAGAAGSTQTTTSAMPSKRNGRRKRSSDSHRKKPSDGTIKAPMQGTIVKVNVKEGQEVSSGEVLFVLEAMKMENPVLAPSDGTAGPVLVATGKSLAAGTLLTTLIPSEEAT